eukprot:COSAG03_NODE_12010_length_566_cov_0.646681_2_plen_40_part_01
MPVLSGGSVPKLIGQHHVLVMPFRHVQLIRRQLVPVLRRG